MMLNLRELLTTCALVAILLQVCLAARIPQNQALEADAAGPTSYVKQMRIKSVLVESTDAAALREAAIAKGMDATAIDELLRKHEPIVRISQDAQGQTKKTTYSLTAKGGILAETEEEVPGSLVGSNSAGGITTSSKQFSDFFKSNNDRPTIGLSDTRFADFFKRDFNSDSSFGDIFSNFPSAGGQHFSAGAGSNGQRTVEKTTDIQLQSSDRNVIKQAVIKHGLDATAIDELYASGKPVVRTQTDKEGQRQTVTYSLLANDIVKISSKTAMRADAATTPTVTVHRNIPAASNNRKSVNEDVLHNIERNIINDNQTPRSSQREVDSDWEWVPNRQGRGRGF